MKVRDFLLSVRESALALLPSELGTVQSRLYPSWLQLYYDDPRIHYEVWLQRRLGRIEIGLHFEATRQESYAWAAVFAERLGEVQAALGPVVELEEWTRSWARLHEGWPLTTLSEDGAIQVATRLTAYVTVLEPWRRELAPLIGQPGFPDPRPRTGRGHS